MKLYTFGYNDDAGWASLYRIMEAPGAVLMDIRFSAVGRPGMRGADFRKRFGEKYEHLKSLGNLNYKSGGAVCFVNEAEGVARCCTMLRDGRAVVLMCACKDASTCHRTLAAERIKQAMNNEIEIIHLA